ncbi:MAG: hypothetical protein MUP81_03850 [Dehalococcoidia bacterium]|nr:hypothetical protein [Dehalococcoidia bacterium]
MDRISKCIIPAVENIIGNEKAIALYELNFQSGHGFHRYQIIQVPRDGVVCEWRKDMGKASNFKGINQLRIPSYMEHTVDELKGIADSLRASKFDVKDFLKLEKYKV